MSVPAWKQAVLERRKKQEEEERKKQEQEDQYLASLPPWKRAIILRNREKSGAGAGASRSPKVAEKSPSNNTTASTQQATPKQSTKPQTNQWQAAVQISVASSPTNKRPKWARTSSPNQSSPKRTRSNLWERNNTLANSVVVPTRAHSFNVSADAQPMSTTTLTLLQQRRGSSTPMEESPQQMMKFSSAVKGSAFQAKTSSSVKTTTPSQTKSAAPANVVPEGSVQLRNKETLTGHNKGSIEEKRRSFENETVVSTAEKRRSFEKEAATTADTEDPALASMPAWKKALILRRRQQQASQEKKETPKPTENQTKTAKTPQMKVQQEVSQSAPDRGVDETDSPAVEESTVAPPSVEDNTAKKSTGKKTSTGKPKTKTSTKNTTTTTSKQKDTKGSGTKRVKKAENKPQPEVVNRAPADNASNKLVTQEGVTLHPPVYKEVEQWANVSETDDKFLSLPAWKQALIKRRRADIAKRSGQNVPEEKTSTESAKPVHTAWSPRNSVDIQNAASTVPNWKQDMLKKRRPTPPPNKIIPEEKIVTDTSTGSSVQSLLGRFGGTQTSRAATPRNKPATANKQNQQQHHVFNVGNAASESSDSEMEDVVVTCIDDDTSDEDDSGIDKGTAMRSRSAPATPASTSPTGTPTRNLSKSILIDPKKKSYRVCCFCH